MLPSELPLYLLAMRLDGGKLIQGRTTRVFGDFFILFVARYEEQTLCVPTP
jgi:hypothetical protein